MFSTKTMLCAAVLTAAVIVTVSADTGKFSTCCTKVSSAKTRVPLEDFIIQAADPPCVEAVIFVTKEGKLICAKPNLRWVTDKMKEISSRKRKETQQINEDDK